MGRPWDTQARSVPQQTNLHEALQRQGGVRYAGAAGGTITRGHARRGPQNFEERRVEQGTDEVLWHVDDKHRLKDTRVNAMLVDPRSPLRPFMPVLDQRQGFKGSRRGPRPRTSSVGQRGVGHGYETSMNFKRIAAKSHPRLRTSTGVRVAEAVPARSSLRGLHRGPGSYPIVSPVKFHREPDAASPMGGGSVVSAVSFWPGSYTEDGHRVEGLEDTGDLLSFTSSLKTSKTFKTGMAEDPSLFSGFARDDLSKLSATQTFPEASIYLTKLSAQLPTDDQSEFQLNHWQVPKNGDYSRPYCTACHFTDCERCHYCFSHKLTRTPRMHMERLGHALLKMNPEMMGPELLQMLQRYARGDAFATDLNWRLGWVPPDGAFCGHHQKQIDHLEAIEAEVSLKYEVCKKELQQEKKLRQQAEVACQKARHTLALEHVDEHTLSQLKKITLQFHDLTHAHAEIVEDLKHMKVNVVKAMKKGSVDEMRGALHRCVRKLDSGHTEVNEHIDASTQIGAPSAEGATQTCSPNELRGLYAAQGGSHSDREWHVLWGADFADQGLDPVGTRPAGLEVRPSSVVSFSEPERAAPPFDAAKARDDAEVLKLELSVPDAPWQTIAAVAGGTCADPEQAAEAAEEVRPQCDAVSPYHWDVLRGFGTGPRETNRGAALAERPSRRPSRAAAPLLEPSSATEHQARRGRGRFGDRRGDKRHHGRRVARACALA